MLDVERWAELRRERFARGVPIMELVRRTRLARNTIRVALRSDEPPAFRVQTRWRFMVRSFTLRAIGVP